MKVKIAFTIDIDKGSWNSRTLPAIKDFRKDVKQYFEAYCKEKARAAGVGEFDRTPVDLR